MMDPSLILSNGGRRTERKLIVLTFFQLTDGVLAEQFGPYLDGRETRIIPT